MTSDSTSRTTRSPEVAELRLRRREALALGGPEAVDRHRARGRLTIRERVEGLVDKNSFQEVGTLTGQGKYRRRHAR